MAEKTASPSMGWVVTLAGLGINLALGVLYTWSVVTATLTKTFKLDALGMPVKVSVPYLAGNFSMANNQHQPYPVKFPRDTASIAFKDIAQQIVEAAKRVRAG